MQYVQQPQYKPAPKQTLVRRPQQPQPQYHGAQSQGAKYQKDLEEEEYEVS